MIRAIVLAAGRSRRMGTQKLLLPYGGRAVLAHIVDQVLRSNVEAAVVVVPPDHAEMAGGLAGRRVDFSVNPDVDGDMLSSVRAGLRSLPAECRGVLVVLGDQPTVTTELINRMIEQFAVPEADIVVPVFAGRRGHPLLFSTAYAAEVLTRFDDTGLRGLLLAHPDRVREFPVATADVLADMDEPGDYLRELKRLERGE